MGVALLIIAAYLCGSVPTGVLAGRLAGVDVRSRGSGNIGATNVARTAGLRPAIVTLLGDIVKGLGPTLIGRWLLTNEWLVVSVGVAAFCGHVFSVFLRFSGGKGVATGFGVFLGVAPVAALLSLLVFAAAAFGTRYVSVASMLGAAALPAAAAALRYPSPVWSAALLVTAIIILRHRDNLARLRSGTERKFEVRR